MAAFFKAFKGGKYDPKKGRLSNWLFGVAKRVILNLRGRQPLERLIADKTTGTSFWDLVQDDQTIRRTWEAEWREMVLQKCLARIRSEFEAKVVRAFELYALSGTSVEAVCQELDMSRNAVYIAKSRILSRLRELAAQFE
jgi:RNA polymerase sigma-70 factor (ECF subfamily)